MIAHDPFHRDALAANRAGHEKRPRFDPVRDNVVLSAVQFFHALDNQAPRARAFDLRAHLVQKIREVDDLWFRRRAFDHRDPFGQCRRHHHVIGPENRRPKFAGEIHHRADQFRRKNFYVAAFHPHRCAQRFESFQMQIDRPIADDAAARH